MCEKKPVIYPEVEEKIIIPEGESEVEYQVYSKCYDVQKDDMIDIPTEMRNFFDEIQAVCKKYNFSISHEDTEGGFEIKRYDEKLMRWLRAAAKNYNEP